MALLKATKKMAVVEKKSCPPQHLKMVRCWGWQQQGVQGWAAPCSACSGLLLATGGETKPPGVTSESEEGEGGEEGSGSARLPRALGSTRGTSMALAQLCWGRAWSACGRC